MSTDGRGAVPSVRRVTGMARTPGGALELVAGEMMRHAPEGRTLRLVPEWYPDPDSTAIPVRLLERLEEATGLVAVGGDSLARIVSDTSRAFLFIGEPVRTAGDSIRIYADWYVPEPRGAYADGRTYTLACSAGACRVLSVSRRHADYGG